MTHEKQVAFSDILVIYTNYNKEIPSLILEWIFALEEGICFQSMLLSTLLRRALIPIKEFDKKSAIKLQEGQLIVINSICLMIKLLIVEERIFSCYTIQNINEELIKISEKPELLN